ncbi:MAG: 1-(5-phosphoribosyl)-5-[(5-phosphoribosylamino)methylideneamino]imidazole-4-carboxamide isomerase [Anaerolineae bacterium]|jgi:phosphoribosylformimino-5-aminoimidazole carboxamide ribotide isomerase|nr:1-(5-phosphoribosyl)-5-[(5-phosphoribosylamino)methylideneamino]imidazole-4-carboxamide isomerase [Anaerolineae bacterium]
MNTFTIYPAIDLRKGRVVRLMQGDPDRETAYADGALAVARQWQAEGATWLHVVNLDGAFGERGRVNLAALGRILTTGLQVQFGGGLRTLEAIRRALDFGVARVVLGTALVEAPELVTTALSTFGPEHIAVGIDARDGLVRIRGWQAEAHLEARVLAGRWAEMGGRWLIFTDVSRDGMQSGVNVASTAALAAETGLQVIASGGVGGLEDVRRVREAGLAGVIVGRALYEGKISLSAALQEASDAG